MKGAYVEETAPRGRAFVYSSAPLLFPTGNTEPAWSSRAVLSILFKEQHFHRAKGMQELQVPLTPLSVCSFLPGCSWPPRLSL